MNTNVEKTQKGISSVEMRGAVVGNIDESEQSEKGIRRVKKGNLTIFIYLEVGGFFGDHFNRLCTAETEQRLGISQLLKTSQAKMLKGEKDCRAY